MNANGQETDNLVGTGEGLSINDHSVGVRVAAVAAANSRKLYEKDIMSLAARIKLLKLEESKALRNASLAQSKAEQIRSVRMDTASWEAERRRFEMEKEKEKQLHHEKVAYMRSVEMMSITNSKEQAHKSKLRDALEVKRYIHNTAKERFEQEKEERARITAKASEIRRERIEARRRVEDEKESRIRAIREDHFKTLRAEERRQIESEALLARLKNEEKELLERVKNAKESEDQIFQSLNLPSPSIQPPSPGRSPKSQQSHRSTPPVPAAFVTRRSVGGPALR
jgi:hypothetical protein